jgi:chromosomal replication initiation ATPase DnaA
MNGQNKQLLLDLPLRQAFGRDDFLVTASNAAAVELIDQWPNWLSYGAIIIGPAGSGKSHLVEVWRQKTSAAICRAEELRIEDIPQLFQNRLLAVEISTAFDERALFHALNFAKQEDAQILITAQGIPALQIPDLRSRLNALPIVAILPPDDELLRGVLVKHFSDRQITVDETMITYIMLRMPRSLEAAQSLVDKIDQVAMVEKAEITRPFVGKVMAEFLSPEFDTVLTPQLPPLQRRHGTE